MLIVIGFNDMLTLMGHFVSSPREREKRGEIVEMKDRDREERGTGMKVKKQKKQEAHGPQLAHLSDITTADMQVTSILAI